MPPAAPRVGWGDEQEGDVLPTCTCQGCSRVYFPNECWEWRALEIKHRDHLKAGGGDLAVPGAVEKLLRAWCRDRGGPGAGAVSALRGSRTRGSGPAPPRPAPPRARGPGSSLRAARGERRVQRPAVTLSPRSDGQGRTGARAAARAARAGADRGRRDVLEAALGHVLVLRQGGARPADPRRDSPSHRQHEGPGQGFPERPPGAAHCQGRIEKRPGGHGGADVVLHRGNNRQGRHHRVQCVNTHLSNASSATVQGL